MFHLNFSVSFPVPGISAYLPMISILLSHLLFLPTTFSAKPSAFSFGSGASIAENRLLLQDRALLHVNLMSTLGGCRTPRPQIVYPPTTSTKFYHPRGTLVHRCSDSTGCCPNVGEVCRPASLVPFEKVFFVNHFALGQRFQAGGARPRLKAPTRNFTTTTEVLTFTNHTACGCVKLASDAVEHDELQSIVSRPLVKRLEASPASSWVYHLIGGLSAVTILMVLLLLYKWMRRRRQY